MARAGHDKDAEASSAEAKDRRQEQRCNGPMGTAEPKAGTTNTSAPSCVDATRS